MKSSWKSSRRRPTSMRTPPGGGGDVSEESNAMSFLDDMLGGPTPTTTTSTTTTAPLNSSSGGGGGGVGGGVSSNDDIGDILDLVSGSSGGSCKKNDEKPGGQQQFQKNKAELSDFGSDPISSSLPTTTTTMTRGPHHNSRRHVSKSPIRPTTTTSRVMGATISKPTTTTTTIGLDDILGGTDEPPRRRSRSRDNNDDGDGKKGDPKADDVPPIPFFGVVNKDSHDDDTISQITTSVASNSFYDSNFGADSRNSGSYPWLRSSGGGTQHPQNRFSSGRQASTTDISYADTLDEIADMLHTPTGRQPQTTAVGGGTGTSGILNRSRGSNDDLSVKRRNEDTTTTIIGRRSTEDLFRKPEAIFRSSNSTSGGSSKSGNGGGGGGAGGSNNSGNSNRFNADEIYRAAKNDRSRRRTRRSVMEPMMAQLRFLVRYWVSLVMPREWRQASKQKSGAQSDEESADYFGTLMRSNSQSSQNSGPKRNRRGKNSGGGGSGGRGVLGSLLNLFGLFCCMTLVILLVRVAMIHSAKFRATGAERNIGEGGGMRLGGRRKKHRNKNKADRPEVKGHMAVRDGVNVHGGMAQHSMDEVQDRPADWIDPRLEQQHGQRQMDSNEFNHDVNVGVQLPSVFDYIADVDDLPVKKGVEIPFFWHIPRTGGGTVNDIFGACMSLTLASDVGGSAPEAKEDILQIVEFSKYFSYVNVDTSTVEGIDRAKALGLASSELADLVVSTLLHNAATLFTPANRGRMFTLFRHPVERAVSLFHFIQDTQWRRRQTYNKDLAELTIDEYFKSGVAENNWVTRFLTNELTKGELTRDDLNLAKDILRRKCLVGLLREKGESFHRFERFFGFQLKDDNVKECHEKKLQWAWPLKHKHEDVEEGTPLWDLILSQNMFDMELYDYAEQLFQEQAALFQ